VLLARAVFGSTDNEESLCRCGDF